MNDRTNGEVICLKIFFRYQISLKLVQNYSEHASALCTRQCTTMSSFYVNVKQIKMALEEFEYERAGYLAVNRRLRGMSSWATK